ncbi:MAG: hypothetical protein EZS28_004826 [Streblomastix strix]|uniref:Uncharacterized protein n=1 Tax=Streblomastix strix TaxID=222440 RepID=A0A5J4WX61_9EUKA|nr:MAG: hypothetical protein EZS28_004826 [Streblomastix strix]
MQESDPRAVIWEHMKDLRYAFLLMLEAAASNDEAKMAEYIQISLPQFLLPVLPACLHILRCMMRDFDQISGMQSQAWTRYFEMLDGMQIPQFSGAEFAEYMQQLRGKRQQQQNQSQEQIVVTPPYSGRITPAFCNQKAPKQVSFRDALGGLFEFRETNCGCQKQWYIQRKSMFDCIQGESQIGECAEILVSS